MPRLEIGTKHNLMPQFLSTIMQWHKLYIDQIIAYEWIKFFKLEIRFNAIEKSSTKSCSCIHYNNMSHSNVQIYRLV